MKAVFCVVVISAMFVAVVSGAGNAEHEALSMKIQNAGEECMKKTGVSEEQMARFDFLKLPEDKGPYCFMACVAKKMGIASEDNKINKDNIMKMLDIYKSDLSQANVYDKIVKGIDQCMAEYTGGSDECAAAKQATQCMVKYVMKEGLMKARK